MQDPGPFSGQTSGQSSGTVPNQLVGQSPVGRVWLTCFVVLFLLAELLQWLKGVRVPGPVFWVGGVLLAIASNLDRRAGVPFKWFPAPDADRLGAAAAAAVPLHAPGSTVDDRGGAVPLGRPAQKGSTTMGS